MTASALKDRLHAVSEMMPEPTRIRIHRAISWLARAEAEADDPDAQFLFPEGGLPPFDTSFTAVADLYRNLPWSEKS